MTTGGVWGGRGIWGYPGGVCVVCVDVEDEEEVEEEDGDS